MNRKATHRCKICGALWTLNPPSIPQPEGSWSLASKTCGKCCDNEPMGDQIEELPAESVPRVSALVRQKNISQDNASRLIEAHERIRALEAQLNAGPILTCVYCGQAYPPGTPTHGAPVLTAHIKVCPKHPLRALEAELKEANEAITALQDHNAKLNDTAQQALDDRRSLQAQVAELQRLLKKYQEH